MYKQIGILIFHSRSINMKIKRKQLYILLSLFISTVSVAKTSDPFIQQWNFFDGVNTYHLNINKSAAPDQDYGISYTFPTGSAATDMCKLTSPTSFACNTGETVTLDPEHFAVKLSSSWNGNFTFYDPNHMPTVSPIYGDWHYDVSYGNNNDNVTHYTLTITKSNNDNEYNVTTSSRDSRGNYCGPNMAETYQVTKNSDGTETVALYNYAFKYNPYTNQISNPSPSNYYWSAGDCAMFDEEFDRKHPVIFKR